MNPATTLPSRGHARSARRPPRPSLPKTPRLLAGLLLLLAPFAFTACGDELKGPVGQLEVAVYQEDRTGAPNKQIEIRDTSQSRRTNAAGLATFTLTVGRYVVRAYELGAPGPATPYQEQTIGVLAGKTAHVEFFDCRLCQ